MALRMFLKLSIWTLIIACISIAPIHADEETYKTLLPIVSSASSSVDLQEQSYNSAAIALREALFTEDSNLQATNLLNVLEQYDHLISLYPENVDLYIHRGVILQVLNQLDDAVLNFNQALQINPRSFAAYQNRAIAYEKQERFHEALVDFQVALHLVDDVALSLSVNNASELDTPFSFQRSFYAEKIEKLHAKVGELEEEVQAQILKLPRLEEDTVHAAYYASGTWYGIAKFANYWYNGNLVTNYPGWICGAWYYPAYTGVENIVYFRLVNNSVNNRQLYIWQTSTATWALRTSFYHNYPYVTGWTTPPGSNYNYYMLFPERNVCLYTHPPAGNFKVTGTYWVP